MQLVRHTIEHLKAKPLARALLAADSQTRSIIDTVCHITRPTYSPRGLRRVVEANLKPLSHPFFTGYRTLQRLCLRILAGDRMAYGSSDDRVGGLLFDGAWLWEEYLATVLAGGFIHPENRTGRHRQYLFDGFQPIYPDFMSRTQPCVVADAKYVPLAGKRAYGEDSTQATAIYYKTITYMYRFGSTRGMLLYPHPGTLSEDVYAIKDTAGRLCKLGMAIAQDAGSFDDFCSAMGRNEADLLGRIAGFARGGAAMW